MSLTSEVKATLQMSRLDGGGGGVLVFRKGGRKCLNIIINCLHHMDFVNIHLVGLTTNVSNPAFMGFFCI